LRRYLSVSKSRSSAGGRKTLLGGAESKLFNNGVGANGGEIYASGAVAIAHGFKPAVAFRLLSLFVHQASYMISITIIAFSNDFPHDYFLC
jgi:hypothetical protein